MMGPIEFALLTLLVLWVCVAFRTRTIQMALHARERMSIVVRDIVNDDKLPTELKKCALNAYMASADTAFMPWLYRETFLNFKKDKAYKDIHLHDEHSKVLENLMREHFYSVNMLVSPHWYILFSVSMFVLILFTSLAKGRGGYSLLRKVEKTIIHPRFPNRNSVIEAH